MQKKSILISAFCVVWKQTELKLKIRKQNCKWGLKDIIARYMRELLTKPDHPLGFSRLLYIAEAILRSRLYQGICLDIQMKFNDSLSPASFHRAMNHFKHFC
jgi:hypothetical protein